MQCCKMESTKGVVEDVTDPAFRLMCKQFGADMVYTEFVSSDALIPIVS